MHIICACYMCILYVVPVMHIICANYMVPYCNKYIHQCQLYCIALVPILQCRVGTNAMRMYVGQAVKILPVCSIQVTAWLTCMQVKFSIICCMDERSFLKMGQMH